MLVALVALAWNRPGEARVRGVDDLVPLAAPLLGPAPSDPFFGLPIAVPDAPPPTGLVDLPHPSTLYDVYDARPDFTLPLPPTNPGPPRSGLVPATPPPPSLPAPLALPERPGAPPPAGGLRQALSEYDRRGGLGAAPAVASLSRGLLQNADAWGSATLVVAMDARGTIQMARVLSSSGDDAAWGQFAAELRGKHVRARLPAEARGIWMTLGVEARTNAARGIGGGPVSVARGGLLTFDLADLAAVPQQRLVQTSVLSEVWY